MKKKHLKHTIGMRSLALGASLAMMMSSAVPAFAADTIEHGVSKDGLIRFTDSVIDSSMKGSITVTKLIENNGSLVQADGTKQNIDTDAAGNKSMTVTSPNRPEGSDGDTSTTEEFSTDSKVASDGDSKTFTGSKNGEGNGNDKLEGGQSNEGHTDSARDNETYDGNEYTQAIAVPNVGYSYKKVGDMVSVASQVDRNKADGFDEGDAPNYTGTGTYFSNIDSDLLAIGTDFGVTLTPTTMTDGDGISYPDAEFPYPEGDYYTMEAVEGYISAIENKGILDKDDSIYDGMTGSQALTEWTKYTESAVSDNQAHQTEGKGMFPLTDKNGEAKVENLDLGLYLIGETDITHHDGLDENGNPIGRDEDTIDSEYPILKNRTDPFLVSIPTTNVSTIVETDKNGIDVNHNPGTVWMYDQFVYPKNSTINISKAIIDPDEKGSKTLRTREDYQIGDTVEQVIWADAPVPQPSFDTTADTDPDTPNVPSNSRDYEIYRISDEMDESLSFNGVSKVMIVPKVANPKTDVDLHSNDDKYTLKETEDYIVTKLVSNGGQQTAAYNEDDYKSRSLHNFTVYLTENGLKKLNAITEDSQVVVLFSATLNNKAIIGPTEKGTNMNQPTLTYKDKNWSETDVKGNKVYVFTHELDLKKDGLADPTKASFVVTRTNNADAAAGNVTNTKNVKEGSRTADGSYLVDFARDNITMPTAEPTWFFKEGPDQATGHLAFVKEADGVYHLYDNSIDEAKGIYAKHTQAEVGKTDDATYDVLGEGTGNVGEVVTVLHPGANGKLIVKGLDAENNTYTLKEIATENGHALLKDTFDIKLMEYDKWAKAGSADYNDQDVWKNGRLVSYPENAVDENGNPINNQVTDGSHVSIGNTSAALGINSDNTGIAEVEIENQKVVTLRTGGTGRMIIYLIVIAGAATLGGYAVASKRKNKKKVSA